MKNKIDGQIILVTGADGFIGSHLVEVLVKNNAKVRALVYYNSWNSIGWLSDLPQVFRDEIEFITGDIRDAEMIYKSVKGCDIVMHLSSLVAIPYSYEATRSFVDTNIHGALNVLNACKGSNISRLVHLSTSEVYGSAQQVPISETHLLVAQPPYSATKIAADKLAESYYRSFGLPVIIARPFNTYGPRQTARAVIPSIISQLLSGSEVLELGSLHPRRDLNYVADVADALVGLAVCEEAVGEVINIGSGKDWSIEEVVMKLMDITGRKVEIVTATERVRPAGSEVERLLADNRKIRTLTGWKEKICLDEGLRLTVEWIRKNLDHFNPDRYVF